MSNRGNLYYSFYPNRKKNIMKKINPKDFLKIKILSPLENSKILGGIMDVEDDKQKKKQKQKQKVIIIS